MKSGIVTFVGAGPGAPDLITVRGLNAVKEADLIIYAGSLVNPEIMSEASKDCEVVSSAGLNLGQMVEMMVVAAQADKKVVRLHTGDPSIYGAIAEQMSELDKQGVGYEVIPGVSSAFASAAVLNAELTMANLSQTIIITRRAGRTPVPEKQNIPSLAAHNATMCIYLSVGDMQGLVDELLEGGYTAETEVGVVYRATWEDQKVIQCTLGEISERVELADITRQAMIIVGDVLKRAGDYSLLYDAGFAHGYRPAAKSE